MHIFVLLHNLHVNACKKDAQVFDLIIVLLLSQNAEEI